MMDKLLNSLKFWAQFGAHSYRQQRFQKYQGQILVTINLVSIFQWQIIWFILFSICY